MKFYCRHWYTVNLIFVPILGGLILKWDIFEMQQKLVLLNLIFLLVHQFEEYGFPGGEPMIMNYVLQGSAIPDRFPLNQFSAMFTNVFTGVILYGLPVLFPDVIWLSMGPMLFNLGQLFVHGVMTNKIMKRVYNPGLGAVVFLHLPVSFYFFWYTISHEMIKAADWVCAFIFTIACAALAVGLMTYVFFASKKTKWVFAEEELARFDVIEKMKGIELKPGQPKGAIALLQKLQVKLYPGDARKVTP